MLSMFAMAASRCAPSARAEGSLNSGAAPEDAGGAGDGVAGALGVGFAEATGAAGAAGVFADAGAGVEGALEVEEEVAGAALGLNAFSIPERKRSWSRVVTFDIMHTMKPFSSML